jgi:hypothetical protein
MSKHAPTPWILHGFSSDGRELIRDANRRCVVGTVFRHSNAEHIVRCVNCFDDLLEACRAVIRDAIFIVPDGNGRTQCGMCALLDAPEHDELCPVPKIQAAIAKAEEAP